jgi:2-methylcitrate dehydratase PrpD
VRLAAFEDDRLRDPKTRSLMERITVGIDPALDATFPRQRAARVAITARGRREELVQPTRKGDPDLPLTDKDLDDKFLELAAPVLGAEAAKKRLAELWATA